jgi:hypothetical protein
VPTTPTAKLVLLALADFADEVGHCWPGMARLVEMTGLSERAVRANLRALEDAGTIKTTRGDGRGHTSRYALQINAAPERGREMPGSGNPERGQQMPERGHLVPERGHVVPERGQQMPPNHQEPSRTVTEPSFSAPRAASPRGGRLPPDWQPSGDDQAFAASLGLDHRDVAAEFRDYWHAVPGSRGCKLDWGATFRNSCRMQAKRRPSRPAATPKQSNLSWMQGLYAAAGHDIQPIDGTAEEIPQ